MKTGGLCECHMLLQTFINVNWEIRSACFVNETCPFKHSAQNRTWMDVPTCYLHRRTCHPVHLLMENAAVYFEAFKEKCCGALFYFQCNNLETAKQFGRNCTCQKINKALLLKYVL